MKHGALNAQRADDEELHERLLSQRKGYKTANVGETYKCNNYIINKITT
ncbi:MAG: hypothetical protein A4E72_00027 [Syntrophus sp. PtaU1.Bin208]|nr:MAG: hypothetical protein A4E72_00027 [Syntrophus sp. PtaU1.Bin208]